MGGRDGEEEDQRELEDEEVEEDGPWGKGTELRRPTITVIQVQQDSRRERGGR